MKPKRLPRLWCALQGLLPLRPVALAPGREFHRVNGTSRPATAKPKGESVHPRRWTRQP